MSTANDQDEQQQPRQQPQFGRKKPLPFLKASQRDSKRYFPQPEAPKRKNSSFMSTFQDEPPADEASTPLADYEMHMQRSSSQRFVERGLANIEQEAGLNTNLQYQSASDDENSHLTTDTELLARIPAEAPPKKEFPEPHHPDSSMIISPGMATEPKLKYDTAVAPMEEIAVAREVHEDYYHSDGIHRPFAKEYHPEFDKPGSKTRRRLLPFLIAGICVCVLLIGGVVGGVLGYQNSSSSSSSISDAGPSNAPSTVAESAYMHRLSLMAGQDIYVANSPQRHTAKWLLYEDPLGLEIDDPTIWQRYALTLFYFTTTDNGSKSWRSCNVPTDENEGSSECVFDELYRQEDDTFAYTPVQKVRWLSAESECDWAGVTCDEGQVHSIELAGQNITGTLPPALASLPYIQSIALHYNDFTGTIPVDYVTTRYMINFDLHGNRLTGTIPTEMYALSNVQQINVGENLLTGTISTDLGRLTSLKGFHVGNNLFEGPIPPEISNLEYLTHTRWDHNLFTGTLPATLEVMTNLQEFWVQGNRLNGEIPSELGGMVDLVDLQLYENQFTGTIPEEIYDLKSLLRLELSNNALVGTISSRIGRLRLLTDFRVRHNQLTGTIPLQLGALDNLRIVWLHMNLLEGSIPENVCNNVGPGFLEFLNADCGPEESPANPCNCCTGCCDRVTEICRLTGNAHDTR